MLSEVYARAAFDNVAARAALCAQLGDELSLRVRDRELHAAVMEIVADLRALGHDLWSFDEDDELEAWCPDWTKPHNHGLNIVFTPDGVVVSWT